jgi:cation:H+ antiporter
MKSPFNKAPSFAAGGGATSTRNIACFALLLLSAAPISEVGPWAALWAAPAILISAMIIAWGAESAQYFIAQGFALAILAWLQTLPEFGVEAVLALKQQVPFLLANLTGALRLLIGFGWPMIYATAAYSHKKESGKSMNRIALDAAQSVNVVGLLVPLIYITRVWWKASLDITDAAVLIVIYFVYLAILSRMPPEDEGEDDLEAVPRAIVKMPRLQRIAAITGLFVVGGGLIFFSSEPFVGSLLAISTTMGIPPFVFIQWVAPFVSEFPEMVSTFYFARTVRKAPMALMNMVSSNINQWTLLTAMLPILYSFSIGRPTAIPFDPQQRLEILMTLGQSLVAMLFLINMELAWWEASVLFGLFIVQFGLSAVPPSEGLIGYLAKNIHAWVTAAYFIWAAVEIVRLAMGRRKPVAFVEFGRTWRKHVRRSA